MMLDTTALTPYYVPASEPYDRGRLRPHKRSDRVRVGLDYAFSHDRSRPAHHTDRCLLQRHVQSHVAFHCCSPSLRGRMSGWPRMFLESYFRVPSYGTIPE